MHEADSFIDEVNDEVRRDRLFRTFRKYGWIGVLAVVVIVGGAAWNEFRKAQATASARALGDEIIDALSMPGATVRMDALAGIGADGQVTDVLALLAAAEAMAGEDPDAAAELLRPLAESTTAPAVYSDLAAFKMVLLGGPGMPSDVRAQILERLATPGAPYRTLAMEQQVIDLAAAGDTEAALAAAKALMQEPQLTQGLLRRMSQLMLALGAGPEDAAG